MNKLLFCKGIKSCLKGLIPLQIKQLWQQFVLSCCQFYTVTVRSEFSDKNRLWRTVKSTTPYSSGENPLFVGNLHAHVPEQVLLATFLPSRPVSFVQVYRDSRTSFSCGSGFVTFAHRHNVENVLNTQMLSKTHRQNDAKTTSIWVMGLSLIPN